MNKSPQAKPKGRRHGTVHCYAKYRCRCPLCKEAKSEYEKARRNKKGR